MSRLVRVWERFLRASARWIGRLNVVSSQHAMTTTDRSVPLAYEALLLGLAVYKAIGYWKENGFHGSHLVRVIITDQIMYYLL